MSDMNWNNVIIASSAFWGAIGTIVSARMAKAIRDIEIARDKAADSDTKVWCDGSHREDQELFLSVCNTGERALAIREIQIVPDSPAEISSFFIHEGKDFRTSETATIKDWIVRANSLQHLQIRMANGSGFNFEIRIKYFDGALQTLRINPSDFGPYAIHPRLAALAKNHP